MNAHRVPAVASLLAALLAAQIGQPASADGDDSRKADPAKRGYRLDEALSQLRMYPKDPYLQYVTLQLARRENRTDEIATAIGSFLGTEESGRRAGRRGDVDLFNIFTGALAVQESLQLDTMRGVRQQRGRESELEFRVRWAAEDEKEKIRKEIEELKRAREKRRAEIVDIASLTGPTIKSHPWEEMLAGKKPDTGSLARKVPEDFFFAEFGSLIKLLDVLDSGDLWAKHLLHQTAGEARSQQIGDRLKRQLAVETNPLVRPFYDLVVEDVAVTGSDLFFNEGSDLTLLFQFKQPAVFKARMDGFLQNAQKADASIKQSTGAIQGISYVHLSNADRSVHVFSAYPEPNLHVRSNSLTALERVLAAIRGKSAEGQPVKRLGDSAEFAYIRTLMPRGAREEDGFLYLSDPFIRRLVGPQLKLTERRRVLCYNHLRMIGHASLMHRSETGRAPESLDQLVKSQCAPGLFGTGDLVCPDGGEYSLSADGRDGICSHHGHSHQLIPCCEHSVARVNGDEADEYKTFLNAYNEYWRTFFDPIAVQIKVSPEQYRLETIVLPLIDNSIYTGLATALGGEPEPLDALPVPQRNIFSVNVRLDKEKLAEMAGLKRPAAPPKQQQTSQAETDVGNLISLNKTGQNLQQIGLAFHNYHDVANSFPAHAIYSKAGKPLLSWRVALLPYLDQAALYNEFHLDEPWDSAHNKPLVDRMPAVYQSLSPQAKMPGKTTYLAPVGKGLMFTGDNQGMRLVEVRDGLSNTILVVQADEEHAVPWTKPEDLACDLKKPAAGLVDYPGTGAVALVSDGRVVKLRKDIDAQLLAALLTRNGAETVGDSPDIVAMNVRQPQVHRNSVLGLNDSMLEALGVPELLFKGIGNQVGMHIYDSSPLFDFNFPAFLGMAFGSFNSRTTLDGEILPISFLVASLNSPVYISIPIRDAAVVDAFLERLDRLLSGEARDLVRGGWFGLESDFYRFSSSAVPAVRCHALAFGPLKFRIFWARIGNAVYIASKPFILDDLAGATAARNGGPEGHAMFHIRSRNWNQVLPEYRLGWAENNRHACLDNVGPLSSVARSLPGDTKAADVCRSADRLYGAHLFCPEGGHYEYDADGKAVLCSIHGSAAAPRQAIAPAQDQSLGKLIGNFTGLQATLTFLEDGLHAVLTIDRK